MTPTGTTRRLAKNSLVQASAFAAQGVTEFVVALVLARFAGAERLGEFTTLVILAGLFAFISSFGLPSLLTREIARIRDDRRQVSDTINAAVGLVFALSVLAVIAMLLIGFASQYSPQLLRALLVTALALGFESEATVVSAPFRAIERLEFSSIVQVVMYVSFMILALVSVPLHLGIDVLMATYLASRILALGAAVRLYRSFFGWLRPTLDLPRWRSLLTLGVPFSINSIFAFTYSRADVVLLSFFAGNTVVGFYEIAYGLTLRSNIVARAVTFALYPHLSFQFAKDARSMRSYTAGGIHYLNIVGFLIAALLWAFGNDLVGLVYGQKFADATALALKLLALAVPLRFLETSLGVSLDASNRSSKRATGVVIAGTTNALLNLLLIPPYRMMGAVYATCLTEVVICVVFIWFMRNEVREIIVWRSFLAPVLGVILILAGLAVLRSMSLYLAIVGSLLLYGLAIFTLDQGSVHSLRQFALKRVPS